MWIPCNLSIGTHINEAKKKINFIKFRMRGILIKGHLKLNNNLFRTFILPQFRLCFSIYPHLVSQQKVHLEGVIRRTFREFTGLPFGTPT